MIIDPDGLFSGERFELVSDKARLYWPHFWCASNTYGRLELNARRIIDRAFCRFKKPPTEAQIEDYLREYNQAFLLYIYAAEDGSVWGQWDCSEKTLPRYKSSADQKSPAPDYEEFIKFRERYIAYKREKNAAKFNGCNNSTNISQTCEDLALGIGIGIGIGKPPISPLQGDLLGINKPKPTTSTEPADAFYQSAHDRFYAAYWRHVNKPKSLAAFQQRVKALVKQNGITPQAAIEFLISEAKADRSRWEHTKDWEWRKNLMPATWLNGCRWEDEVPSTAQANPPSQPTPSEPKPAYYREWKPPAWMTQ